MIYRWMPTAAPDLLMDMSCVWPGGPSFFWDLVLQASRRHARPYWFSDFRSADYDWWIAWLLAQRWSNPA